MKNRCVYNVNLWYQLKQYCFGLVSGVLWCTNLNVQAQAINNTLPVYVEIDSMMLTDTTADVLQLQYSYAPPKLYNDTVFADNTYVQLIATIKYLMLSSYNGDDEGTQSLLNGTNASLAKKWFPNVAPLTPELLQINTLIQVVRPLQPKEEFIFYILFFLLVLLAFIRLNYYKYLKKLSEAFFNINIAYQFYEDYNHDNPARNVILFIMTTLSISVSIYLLLQWGGIFAELSSSVVGLLYCFVVAVGFLLVRRLLLKSFALIFPVKKTLEFYLFNQSIFNVFLGILLVPFAIILAFSNNVLSYFTVVSIIFIVLIKLLLMAYRGLNIGKPYLELYKFHFILYICTFEIVPLLILYKIISSFLI